MSDLQDIGGGNKMLSVGSALGQAKDLLSLVDLANKVKRAPSEQAISEAQARIQGQDATPDALNARLIKQQAEAISASMTEKRAQADFSLKFLQSIPDIAGQNFEAAQLHVQQGIASGVVPPGTMIVKNDKLPGTFAMIIPRPDGSRSTIPMDPARQAKAEDRLKTATALRGEWEKVGSQWEKVAEFHQDFESNMALKTGASDFIGMFAALKTLDRMTQVGQGQTKEFLQSVASLRQQISNKIDSVKDKNSPMFGESESKTREALINGFRTVYQNAEHNALQHANFFAGMAQRLTDNPQDVVQPFGGIGYKQATGQAPVEPFIAKGKQASNSATTETPVAETSPSSRPEGTPDFGGRGSKPVQAGVPTERAAKAPPTKPATWEPQTLDEVYQRNLIQGGQ